MQKMDIRRHPGNGPKCEVGLCRNRSVISVGAAEYRSGMGRLNLCQECADAMRVLLNEAEPAPAPEKPAREIPTATPAEGTEPGAHYRAMKRNEILAEAKRRNIKFSATSPTNEIIEELMKQDAIQ